MEAYMTKQDAVMFAIYLIVIAAGSQLHNYVLGISQVLLGAALFGLRLWVVAKRAGISR